MIPIDDAQGIIKHYAHRFGKASKLERAAIWQSCIHDFRLGSYLWHAERADLIGKTVWWLVPKHTSRANWHEIYQGQVVEVLKENVFEVQAGRKRVRVRLNRIVTFASNGKPLK